MTVLLFPLSFAARQLPHRLVEKKENPTYFLLCDSSLSKPSVGIWNSYMAMLLIRNFSCRKTSRYQIHKKKNISCHYSKLVWVAINRHLHTVSVSNALLKSLLCLLISFLNKLGGSWFGATIDLFPSLIKFFGHSHTYVIICGWFWSFWRNRWTFMKMKKQRPSPPFSTPPSEACTCWKWDFCHRLPADTHWISAIYAAKVVLWKLLKRKVWVVMTIWRINVQKIASLVCSHKTECKLKSNYLHL